MPFGVDPLYANSLPYRGNKKGAVSDENTEMALFIFTILPLLVLPGSK